MIIMDEKSYAESILAENSMAKNPMESMNLLARYYFYGGHKKRDIHEKLEEFLLRRDPNVNLVKWQTAIDRISARAGKYPLIQIESVPVTQKELDVCASVRGKQAKQLMFALICFAKFAYMVNKDNSGWVNKEDRDIFVAANVVTNRRRQAFMLHDLRDAGLIRFGKRVDNVNINVCCLDLDGAPVLSVTDMRNLGNQYQNYMGGGYIECAGCGLVVRKMSNAQKYCRECASDVHKKKAADTSAKKRIAS